MILILSTGSEGGDCMLENGVRALCADAASDSAYARCDAGCLFTGGTGSCSLAGEAVVPGSFVLACEDGSRYLLRTRTGRGNCNGAVEAGTRRARCTDRKDNVTEASCKTGCLPPRGKAMCARYKPEAGRR